MNEPLCRQVLMRSIEGGLPVAPPLSSRLSLTLWMAKQVSCVCAHSCARGQERTKRGGGFPRYEFGNPVIYSAPPRLDIRVVASRDEYSLAVVQREPRRQPAHFLGLKNKD